MKYFFKTLFSLLFFLLLSGCAPVQPETPTLKVMTTIAPLYSFTTFLTQGTNTKVVNLVPPGASEHTFQLTPSLRQELEKADIVVINGVQLEEFLEDTLSALPGEVVDTSIGVTLLRNPEEAHEHEEESEHHEEEEDEHTHGGFDPHIWLHPENAKIQVDAISRALIRKDPVHKDIYEKNRADLFQKLTILREATEERISKLNLKPYIVFHNAYQYFEVAFDIKHSAAFEEFPGKEPSPAYLKELIEEIQEKNIAVIFTEPQFSPKLVQTIAAEYNLKVAELDPLGKNLSPNGYFEMMEGNVKILEEIFSL